MTKHIPDYAKLMTSDMVVGGVVVTLIIAAFIGGLYSFVKLVF